MNAPEGWKLVPIKPTKEMKAACRVAGKTQVWDDMLAAAPSPEVERPYTDCNVVCLASRVDGVTCPDDSCDIEDGTRPSPAVEPVTVIGGFLQQDPSTIPTTDEHNARLVEQIEELRESLDAHRENAQKLIELNHKIITENAALKAAPAPAPKPDAAVAAIKFAVRCDDPDIFLRLWLEGGFDVIRSEWPEAPEEIYIGADPLYKVKP